MNERTFDRRTEPAIDRRQPARGGGRRRDDWTRRRQDTRPLMAVVAVRIADAMKAQKRSEEMLACLAGVSRRTVQRILAAENVSLDVLYAVALALGVGMSDLVADEKICDLRNSIALVQI